MAKKSVWFSAALLVQLGILMSLPLSRDDSGKEIWLPARATNLQDVMRGSGLRLHYDFGRIEAVGMRGETVYAVLRQRATLPGQSQR